MAASTFPAAIEAFRASLAIDGQSVRVLNNLGAAYLYGNNAARAVLSFQQAIALRPDAPAYNNLGAALLQSGDQPGAIRAFREALRLDSGSDTYAANIGLTYGYAGNHRESMRYFRLACELASKSPEIRTQFAAVTGRIAYYDSQLGQLSQAVRLISSARDLNPNSTDLLYHDLVIRTAVGDLPRARESARLLLLRGYSVSRITCNPQLRTLLQDSNFQELLRAHTQRSEGAEMPHCSFQAF